MAQFTPFRDLWTGH